MLDVWLLTLFPETTEPSIIMNYVSKYEDLSEELRPFLRICLPNLPLKFPAIT